MSGDHLDWDIALVYGKFTYNTSLHNTTGRTAQSNDWIFHASFRKDQVYSWLAGGKSEFPVHPVMDLGNMPVQGTNVGTVEIRNGSEQEKDGDQSDLMEIVRRNGKARGELDSLEKRIQQLVEDDNRRVETIYEWHYLWEMYGVVTLSLVGLISGFRLLRNQEREARLGLQRQLVELEDRLSAYEGTIDE